MNGDDTLLKKLQVLKQKFIEEDIKRRISKTLLINASKHAPIKDEMPKSYQFLNEQSETHFTYKIRRLTSWIDRIKCNQETSVSFAAMLDKLKIIKGKLTSD